MLLSNAPCERIIISSATLAAQNPLKHHLSLPCEDVPPERWYEHWFSENKEENYLPTSKYKFQKSHAPLWYFREHIANFYDNWSNLTDACQTELSNAYLDTIWFHKIASKGTLPHFLSRNLNVISKTLLRSTANVTCWWLWTSLGEQWKSTFLPINIFLNKSGIIFLLLLLLMLLCPWLQGTVFGCKAPWELQVQLQDLQVFFDYSNRANGTR